MNSRKTQPLISEKPLDELTKEELIAVLKTNLSNGAYNKLDNETAMENRGEGELYNLVIERIVQIKTLETYPLFDSLLKKAEIEAEVAEKFPDAQLEFRSWLTPEFLSTPMSSKADFAGVRTALLGSLWLVGIAISVCLADRGGRGDLPGGIRRKKSLINRLIQTNINNLAGVPSIVYGILGLAIFVRATGTPDQRRRFWVVDPTTANGRTMLSAGLTLGLLVLPVIIINAQEAIRAVPQFAAQGQLTGSAQPSGRRSGAMCCRTPCPAF